MTMISTYPTSIADNAASENWARYLYGKDRGHTDYLLHAARCEDMYLGGGRQLTPEQRAALIMARRPGYEFNQIMPSVNSAMSDSSNVLRGRRPVSAVSTGAPTATPSA